MSVGIVEPKTHPSQLNAAEFLWDLNKRTSVFVQVTHIDFSSPAYHILGVLLNVHIKHTCILMALVLLSVGALHQHRVHSQEARWREGRSLQDTV